MGDEGPMLTKKIRDRNISAVGHGIRQPEPSRSGFECIRSPKNRSPLSSCSGKRRQRQPEKEEISENGSTNFDDPSWAIGLLFGLSWCSLAHALSLSTGADQAVLLALRTAQMCAGFGLVGVELRLFYC